jgi:hypothetical protein
MTSIVPAIQAPVAGHSAGASDRLGAAVDTSAAAPHLSLKPIVATLRALVRSA